MKTDLTFEELCRMLKNGSSDAETLNALDALSGALMVLSPAVIGVPAASVFGLLEVKNEVVKAGKFLIGKFRYAQANDKLTRHDLLLTVYCLSCYTAFFEALARLVPELREYLEPEDRTRITFAALSKTVTDEPSSLVQLRIELPHPNDPIEQTAAQLNDLYSQMARGIDQLLRQLAVWDRADGAARDRIQAAIRELPDQAKNIYKGQYVALCTDFPEFSVWANLQEHNLNRQAVEKVGADVRAVLKLLDVRQNDIDIGLTALNNAVAGVLSDSTDEVLKGLGLAYRASVEEPIIDDTYASGTGVDLRYPKKSEIFVPQAFRSLRYRRGDRLEDEKLWKDLPVKHDIGTHVLAHLASPYCLSTPLVVLGHPGSGKSLLTEVLAARLASAEYHPIRVKLRNINPESEIQDQIEDQIRDDTGHEINWAELAAHCDRPPLVILDGYDELLQASGKVFGNYLKKVAAFQRREQVQEHPVRVIVTSRVTLIDKADVPIAAPIIRLEDFDADRQAKWAKVWNTVNHPYFESHGVKPFSVPSEGDVAHLAQQPLLLLMLALYDSDQNQLSLARDLDQTVLYHNLLLRFITRERQKDDQFRALSAEDRKEVVRTDLGRLSVAATGMFNRRALYISKDELQRDIEYFKVGQEPAAGPGIALSQAELLLGSFFFVHESRSRSGGESGGPAAFEFLHNTFGEFLAAEWLLAMLVDQVKPIALMQAQPALAGTLQQQLDNREWPPPAWFATLMTTPLFSRPVVMQMLKEWSAHRLRDIPDFVSAFEVLLYSQLRKVLSNAELPTMLLAGDTPFHRGAALTNIATYTLNLVLLRTLIGGSFQVDLDRLKSNAFPKPWANLIDLWRAGLGQEVLMGATSVLQAKVDDRGVLLSTKDPIALPTMNYLWGLYELGNAIGDDQLTALAGWAIQDAEPVDAPSLEDLAALPAIVNTLMRDEVLARAQLRNLVHDGRIPPTRHASFTASAHLLRGFYPRSVDSGHSNSMSYDLLVNMNAELALRLWHSTADFEGKLNEDQCKTLVMSRPILVADIIAHRRTIDDVRLIGRRGAADLILEAALDIISVDETILASDVQYELLLSSDNVSENVASRLLEDFPDIWTIARRPRRTILELLELSERTRRLRWVRQMIIEFGAGAGPDLVKELGGETALTILRYRSKIGNVRKFDKEIANMRFKGVVNYAMEQAFKKNPPRTAVEEYIKLVAFSSKDWLRTIQGPFEEMRREAEFFADRFYGELSSSTIEAVKRLRARTRTRPS